MVTRRTCLSSADVEESSIAPRFVYTGSQRYPIGSSVRPGYNGIALRQRRAAKSLTYLIIEAEWPHLLFLVVCSGSDVIRGAWEE